MYKIDLYNVSVTYEAGGSWKVGDERRNEGGKQKQRRRWSPRELEDGERRRRRRGVEGGKVWKLADRTGYAQTGSQAQAQT